MKRIIKISILAVIITIFCQPTNAQNFANYIWEAYKFKFAAPSDIKIKTNTATQFEAGNETIKLSIYPQKISSLPISEIENTLFEWSVKYELENIELLDQEIFQVQKNVTIYCTQGTKDGWHCYFLYLQFANNLTNEFYVLFQFADGQDENVKKIISEFNSL